MDTYIILAGGYWHQSRKPDMGGVQVDPDNGDATRTLDYLIKINNLPESFIKPLEIQRKFRFYCDTCKRWVKEIEIEQKVGCIVTKEHKVKMEYRDVEMWETGVLDRYILPKSKWITPCYRIYVNTSKGIEKWRDIWRYIIMTLPATERPNLPKCVGEGNQWTITEDVVPVISLPVMVEKVAEKQDMVSTWTPLVFDKATILGQESEKVAEEAPKVDEAKESHEKKEGVDTSKLIPCPECGAMVRGKRGLNCHMRAHAKSKEKTEGL